MHNSLYQTSATRARAGTSYLSYSTVASLCVAHAGAKYQRRTLSVGPTGIAHPGVGHLVAHWTVKRREVL